MTTGKGGTSGAGPWTRTTAPIKLNMGLQIVGRRADGYHLLESLFLFASCGDRIAARLDRQLSLTITGPFASGLGEGADNLVLRAAEAMRAHVGQPALGARLVLDKRLPVASGLGGGSADAAATLRLLNRLWRLRVPRDELHQLAVSLGADVLACLVRRPQWVTGVGEQVEPLPIRQHCPAVIVNPGVALATPAVFKALATARAEAGLAFRGSVAAPKSWADAAALVNDLEAPARTLVPEITSVLAVLAAQPGAAWTGMSGSGASCFALFASKSAAQRARRSVQALQPDWWCHSASVALPMVREHA
jgi:4-diphosphocytidyl-2-C-methyl-D-erythritol kinase